jgi:hypothetical protein
MRNSFSHILICFQLQENGPLLPYFRVLNAAGRRAPQVWTRLADTNSLTWIVLTLYRITFTPGTRPMGENQ